MAAKKKGKKKAVKKAAGRKPVAQRTPRKKREPVPQHGLPPDPPKTNYMEKAVSHSDREAVASVLLDRGEGGTRPAEPVTGTVAVEVPVEVPVGGTVGMDSGEGATKTLKIFKAEAEGDTIYVEAEDLDQAKNKFAAVVGEIPESLVTWTQVDALPEGEELMAEPHTLDDDEEDHTAGSGMEPDDDFDDDKG